MLGESLRYLITGAVVGAACACLWTFWERIMADPYAEKQPQRLAVVLPIRCVCLAGLVGLGMLGVHLDWDPLLTCLVAGVCFGLPLRLAAPRPRSLEDSRPRRPLPTLPWRRHH